MRRFLKITVLISMVLLLFISLSTSLVKRTSYFNDDYFKITRERIDSIRAVVKETRGFFEAGFAKVSITPFLNDSVENYHEGKFIEFPLAGYGDRKGKPATGIHDSIFVKAVALKMNADLVVFVGADLLIMPPNITDSVVKTMASEGIDRQQLVFSATHTHSGPGGWGPGFIGRQFAGDENTGIQKWLIRKISECIILAINDLKPARIGAADFKAGGFTRNRVLGESGTKNNDFSFICIEQEGSKRAIIGSYSAHATTIGAGNMEISGDYPGYWQRKIESTSADIALFCAGAIGSQSPVGTGEQFDKAKYIGESLADSVNVHLKDLQLNDSPVISFVSIKMELPEYHIRLTPKINLSTFWSKRLMPLPENVYIQAVRIDDMVWITTPGDFSGEYALQIKNTLLAEGFESNITSFNGSYVGYIVPGRYFYLGGYEPGLMGWFGPDMGEYTMDLIRQIAEIVTGHPAPQKDNSCQSHSERNEVERRIIFKSEYYVWRSRLIKLT